MTALSPALLVAPHDVKTSVHIAVLFCFALFFFFFFRLFICYLRIPCGIRSYLHCFSVSISFFVSFIAQGCVMAFLLHWAL